MLITPRFDFDPDVTSTAVSHTGAAGVIIRGERLITLLQPLRPMHKHIYVLQHLRWLQHSRSPAACQCALMFVSGFSIIFTSPPTLAAADALEAAGVAEPCMDALPAQTAPLPTPADLASIWIRFMPRWLLDSLQNFMTCSERRTSSCHHAECMLLV